MRQQIYGPWVWLLKKTLNDVESKAIVFSDASWLTDNYLGKGFNVGQQTIQPHAIMLSDTLFWLTDQRKAPVQSTTNLMSRFNTAKKDKAGSSLAQASYFLSSSLVSDEFESLVVLAEVQNEILDLSHFFLGIVLRGSVDAIHY